jgi:hypothetical protein
VFNYGWIELRLRVPDELMRAPNDVFELTLNASRTFQPQADGDDRELSIAVCNIQVETGDRLPV